MENREDLKSIIPFLPLILRSSSLFWQPPILEALKALSKGPEHSNVDSGRLLALAISDLTNSFSFSPYALQGYSLFFDDVSLTSHICTVLSPLFDSLVPFGCLFCPMVVVIILFLIWRQLHFKCLYVNELFWCRIMVPLSICCSAKNCANDKWIYSWCQRTKLQGGLRKYCPKWQTCCWNSHLCWRAIIRLQLRRVSACWNLSSQVLFFLVKYVPIFTKRWVFIFLVILLGIDNNM